MTRHHLAERIAWWIAAACGLLGFAASLGNAPLPPFPVGLVWPLHGLVIACGVAGAWLAHRRHAEIEARRWATVEEPGLTSGEREWAHKEAERAGRMAHLAFILAPLLGGYWLAYQFPAEAGPAARALAASSLVGTALGLLVFRERDRG